MARIEGFTYNGYVVGTAAPTATTELVGMRFGWDSEAGEDEEQDEFCAEFIITGTSRADLETKCTTMRAALRTKNAALSVDWGATNVASYTPLVATATGWDGRPRLRKSRKNTRDVGYTRGFEFRVQVRVPSNYVDPNLAGAAANGRRTSSVSMRWDTGNRRVVTIQGKFHEIPTKLPRQQTTTAALNNPTGTIDTYCVARLAKIDPAVQWTIGSRDEQDNNTQTEMTFKRDYYETIAGRFVSTPAIGFSGTRQRVVVFKGLFFRTYSATYDGSSTRSASVNYSDAATGALAYCTTQLAAFTLLMGGPLTVGTDCELVHEEAIPNDEDDKLEFTLVFREELFKQSNASTPGLDDADIINDSIKYVLDYTPLDDSSVPAAGGAGGPNPFTDPPTLEGSGGGKPANTGAPGTLDKSVVPPSNPLGGTPGTTSGVLPTKPVSIVIEYTAEIKKTVLDPRGKWYTDIRPWLVSQWANELGFGPTYLAGEHFDEAADANTIHAYVLAVALPGDLLSYQKEEAVDDDLGSAFDGAFTGTPYEYLLQQELPERRKYRRHTATYKTGGSFNPSVLLTQTAIPGYLVLRRSAPKYADKTVGIPGLGVPNTQKLTTISFVEELLYVARNVGLPPGTTPNGGASSGGSAGGGAGGAGGNGGGPVAPVNPARNSIFQNGGYVF